MQNKTHELQTFYNQALQHKLSHDCGGVPYEYADVLRSLVATIKPKRILELGTGIGYTAAAMALGSPTSQIDTIDQDDSHLAIAQEEWKKFEVLERISPLHGKAEALMSAMTESYDFIFFDGYAPQMKFLLHFERLLKPLGLLVSANLFLQDPKGGTYLRHLRNERNWITGVFADTAVSTHIRQTSAKI